MWAFRPPKWTTEIAAYLVLYRFEVAMTIVDESPRTSVSRIVLVDTRRERRELMRHVLQGDDAGVILVGEADNRATALAVIAEQRADAVVLDIRMPVEEGFATISALREQYPDLGIVVCSFDLDQATVQRVLAEGGDSCFAKPVNRRDIQAALTRLRRDEPRADRSAGSPVTAILHPAVVAG